MKAIAAALFLALSILPVRTASSAELVMVELDSCIYCMRFDRQMARAYEHSAVGKSIPLRRVDLMERWPADLKEVDRPPYTPVFILVENGKELGRFNGYANPRQFNRDLQRLLNEHG